MPKVIVDPKEMRHFARVLANAIVDLRARKSQISGRFNDLHSEWHDAKYDKFAQSFNETLDHLKQFCDESERLVQFLHRKASKTDGY